MPVAKSRRKINAQKKEKLLSSDNYWCRKCMQHKDGAQFFTAVDLDLDVNGRMSVCKDCCNDIYEKNFMAELSMEKAILKTCRTLNLQFNEAAIRATQTQMETYRKTGRETKSVIGLYKGKLLSVQNTRLTEKDLPVDLTYSDPSTPLVVNDLDDTEESTDLKQFWGENLVYEDYVFLEKELDEWKKTHKADTKAEITLLKELCYKSLEIRKARVSEKSTASMVKELQDLMKTASVDPAKTSQAGSGKAQDTFSAFIQIIEQNEPADFYKDKELFKDVDNIDFYFRKYIVRPLKNFITGSRDFSVEEDDLEEDEFEQEDTSLVSEFLEKEE